MSGAWAGGIVAATMRNLMSPLRLPLAVVTAMLFAGSIGAAQLRRPVPMPPNLFNVIKLNDHLYIIAPSGPDTSNVGGNIGVCIADEGVLLVDANYNLDWRNGQAVPMAQSVINEVKKLTPKPIRWVINTHHHGDHAGGDPVFGAFATIVSHKNARERILSGYQNAAKNAPAAVKRAEDDLAAAKKANDAAKISDAQDQLSLAQMNLKMVQTTDPKKSAPTLLYDTEMVYVLSNEEVHLYHFGKAHTDGDTLVFFKNSNVIQWGDTFSSNWVPAMDASGNSFEWVDWLDKGMAISPSATMVPGHGQIGKQADVMKLRAFFTTLQTAVAREIAAGKTREQVMDAVKLPEYENYPGGAPRLRGNIGTIYDQVKAGRGSQH
jgi:glyoxylase-like metal-dependent hydrolase (beta-lactamase superfamily II)